MPGLCSCTDSPVGLFDLPLTHAGPAPRPLLTRPLSAHRLAHPEGSLPDLAMMHLTASLERPEGRKLAEPGEEQPEGSPGKAEKGDFGEGSEEPEEGEDEEEESEEEEEMSGNLLPAAARARGRALLHSSR